MRVLVFGASGMVGKAVLLEALDDPRVEQVVSVGRRALGLAHPKLVEIEHQDFADFSALEPRFAGLDACFFCMGASAAGMSEADYVGITETYTLAAARSFLRASPGSVFVYVSGAGTDAAGRQMWQRVKGRVENALLAMPFGAAYMFRPGFIRPERGVVSRTGSYRAIYALTRPFHALMVRAMPRSATTSTRVGRAMLHAAATRPSERLVETSLINAWAMAA